MSKCADCKKEGNGELVIDHLVPRSSRDFNHENNLRMVHRDCHKKPKWYVRLWRTFNKFIGKVLCFLGRHKWRPAGKISIDWRSKWEVYEVCQGVCARCHLEVDEIRRDYYW